MVRGKTVTKIPTPSHPRRSMPMAGIVTPAPSRAVSHETTASMRVQVQSLSIKNKHLVQENYNLRNKLRSLESENLRIHRQLMAMKENDTSMKLTVNKIFQDAVGFREIFDQATMKLERLLAASNEMERQPEGQSLRGQLLTEEERMSRRRESFDAARQVFRERTDLTTIVECSVRPSSNGFRLRLSSARLSDRVVDMTIDVNENANLAGNGIPRRSEIPSPPPDYHQALASSVAATSTPFKSVQVLPSTSSGAVEGETQVNGQNGEVGAVNSVVANEEVAPAFVPEKSKKKKKTVTARPKKQALEAESIAKKTFTVSPKKLRPRSASVSYAESKSPVAKTKKSSKK